MLGTPRGDQHVHEVPLAAGGSAAADAVAGVVVGAAGGVFALDEDGRGALVRKHCVEMGRSEGGRGGDEWFKDGMKGEKGKGSEGMKSKPRSSDRASC